MIKKSSDMILLTSIVKAMLNLSLAWYGFMATVQVLDKSIFLEFLEFMPSKIAMVFGFIYLCFIMIKKCHDTYTHIKINQTKIKKANEEVEQSEIHTDVEEEKLKTMKKKKEN